MRDHCKLRQHQTRSVLMWRYVLTIVCLLRVGNLLGQGPSSNWSATIRQVALPNAVATATTGIRGVGAFPDGYVYIGSEAGVYRALTSCIAADPANSACWANYSAGLPARSGASGPNLYPAAQTFDMLPDGTLVVGLGDTLAGGTNNCMCQVVVRNPKASAFVSSGTTPFEQGHDTISAVLHDAAANVNIYAVQQGIYKSANRGASFANVNGSKDAYQAIGLTTGFLYDAQISGGNMYWGGEGPLVRQPLDFSSSTILLRTANGGCSDPNCYAHNMRGSIGDGTLSTAPASELLALINNCVPGTSCAGTTTYVQRENLSTGAWSPVANIRVPNTSNMTGAWTMRRLAKGATAHEYYVVGGSPGQTVGGVLGTTDGGVTWTILGSGGGQTFTCSSNDDCPGNLAVSPVDDSKYMVTRAGLTAGQLWFHPGAATGPPPPQPAVFNSGVVNNASYAAGTNALAPGTIAAVFGTNLNNGAAGVPGSFGSNGKLLTTLDGASVTFNGTISAPLFSSQHGSQYDQLNLQIPYELAGATSATVVVTVGGQSSPPQNVPLGPFSPGIFTLNSAGSGQGAILISNTASYAAPFGTQGITSRPAVRGVDFITIYCTGLGSVTNPPATGAPASSNPLSMTVTTPQVSIGGVPATPSFSGLAPGYVGLYQVDVQVPAGSLTGDAVLVVLTIGGVSSNVVTIAVQ